MAFKSGDDLPTLRAWKRAKSSADHDDHGTQIAVGLGWLDHEDDLPDQNLDTRNAREVSYTSSEEPVTLADLVTADVIREAQRIVTVRECLNCRKEFHPQGKGNYCADCEALWTKETSASTVNPYAHEICVRCKKLRRETGSELCTPCTISLQPNCETHCGRKAGRDGRFCQPCRETQSAVNNDRETPAEYMERWVEKARTAVANDELPDHARTKMEVQFAFLEQELRTNHPSTPAEFSNVGGEAARICAYIRTTLENIQQEKAKEALQLDIEARRYHNLGLKGSNGLTADLDFIRANIIYFRREARTYWNRNLNAKTGASQERAKKDAERRARQLARSINPNRTK